MFGRERSAVPVWFVTPLASYHVVWVSLLFEWNGRAAIAAATKRVVEGGTGKSLE
jgi:hypothetical protein